MRRRTARGLSPPAPRLPSGEGPRAFCYRCRRAQVVCLCGELPTLETRTRIVFLQHEDEAWNRIGTARLAHLSLVNSLLVEGFEFDRDPRLGEALAEPGRQRALLFPSHDAVELGPRDPSAPPLDLVVVDGTWSQAKGVVKKTRALRELPRVKLPKGERSRYRIRREPRPECLSTVEAAVRALGILEGEPERLAPLLEAFDRMIDRQIACAVAAGRSPVPDLRRERARRPLQRELAGDLDRIVLVFGETLGRDLSEEQREVRLVQWLALRPATGEVFSALVDPGRRLLPHEATYLDLSPEAVKRDGLGPSALVESWSAFSRPGDVHVSWGYFASNVLESLTGESLPDQVDLRWATKLVLNRRVQHPENALVELEIAPPPALAPGRGGRRLAALEKILWTLRNPLGEPEAPRSENGHAVGTPR
jgi:DTW domain-containing protein YfiP